MEFYKCCFEVTKVKEAQKYLWALCLKLRQSLQYDVRRRCLLTQHGRASGCQSFLGDSFPRLQLSGVQTPLWQTKRRSQDETWVGRHLDGGCCGQSKRLAVND